MHAPENVESVTPYGGGDAKSGQVRRMFDSIAPAYDLMNSIMSMGLHRFWRNHALKPLNITRDDCVLDIATGTGDLVFNIAEKYRPARITGLDISPGMLQIARERLDSQHSNLLAEGATIDFVAGSALNLPFPDNSFDVVTVAYGVRNFENLLAGFREMWRVLRPGGRICVIELAVPSNPLVKPFYYIYTRAFIPLVGRLVSGDASAYRYLPASIAACPQRSKMTALMQNAGFQNPSWKTLTLGVIGLYHAHK